MCHCEVVIVLRCLSATMLQCYCASVLQYYCDAVQLYYCAAVLMSCRITVLQCYLATAVLLCSSFTMLQSGIGDWELGIGNWKLGKGMGKWATTTPQHLTITQCSDNKVHLVNMSLQIKWPGGQRQWQPGVVQLQHDQEEGYQQPITFRRVSLSGQVEIKIKYQYTIPSTLYGAWQCSTVGLVLIWSA